MPLFTPGLTYTWSKKAGKYRVGGGRRNKRPRLVARTAQNRRRLASLNTMLGTMGAKSRMRLAPTGAMRAARAARRGRQAARKRA